MLPFALQAAVGCPPLDQLHLALAAEFGPVDEPRVDQAIEDLAAGLAGAQHDDPATQLALVAREVASQLRLDRDTGGLGDLLLPQVVVRRAGHPLALAVVVAAAAGRAGLPFGVVASSAGAWAAHARLRRGRVVDPAGGLCVDADACGADLRWQCAHQSTARVLDRVLERAERLHRVDWATRAAELRLALPYPGEVMERLEHDRRRVVAWMN